MELLLSSMVSNAASAALLAGAAAVCGRICRRPAVRHALWLLVLLKLITPPLVPLHIAWPARGESESPSAELPSMATELASMPETAGLSESRPESTEPVAAVEAGPSITPIAVADVAIPLVIVLWLAGALIWWMLAAVRLRNFQRLLRRSRPAPAQLQEQARRLAALLGLRRCPPVVFVSAPLSPMLWALGWSPRLLLPADLWQRLRPEQQDTLLAHELAHLRRGDHWVRRLEFVVLGLYWWHPVVWWARRRLQEAEEECCDARVVSVLPEAASDYAAALFETVTFLAQTRTAALVGASGAGQVPLLKRRLTMILTANPSPRGSRAAFWTVLGMGALLLPLAPGLVRTEEPAEPPREQAKPQAEEAGRELLLLANPHEKLHHLTLDMQNCVSCHQAATVHSRDLQGKPQSWREAHDEIVRLMGEMRRLRSQLGEVVPRLPPPVAAESNRAEQIEKLCDEIELLKLQVQMKEAQLHSTKAAFKQILGRKDSMLEQNRRQPGSIPRDELTEAANKVEALTAEVKLKELELQEAQVRLKQAERRLARLQPAEKAAPQQLPQSLFHDFGKVKHGALIEVAIPIRNGRDKPLRVRSIRSSSGALTAKEKEIAAGEKGGITVRLDAGRFTGVKEFIVFVQWENVDLETQLRFRAESVATLPASSGAAARDKQAQLKELEHKLQDLLKEVRDLQHDKRPDQPRDPSQRSEPLRP